MSQDNIDIGICFKTRLVGLKSRLSLWLLCFTVGCIGAICIALLVGHRTYVSKAILGFQPLEIIKEGQAKEILNTFKDSVKLESILSKVRKDLSLDMTLVQLAKHCDARIVKKTSLLTIQCSGETAIEALDVSKSVVEHFLRWQIEQRHLITTRKIQGHELRLKEINSSILNLESKVLKIQNNFLSLNLEQESQRLLLTLGSVKLKLEEAKIDKNSSISQRSSLDHILMSLKKKQKNDQDQFEQMEQLSDVSIRSKRLRENIKDNQLFRWHSAKLKKLKALYKRQVSLSEQGIIPISTLEATKSELDSASAYVFESKKTSAWKKELKKLDELVIPKSNTISKSSILLKEVMMKGLEIDLGRNSADNTIQHLEVMVKSIERTLKEISLSNQKLKLLNRDIDSLIKERYFIDERRNKLLSIVNSDLADFIYVSTPDLAIYPVKSSYRLIAIVLGVFSFLGGFLLILVLEMMDRTIRSKEQLEIELSLPTLGQIKSVLDEKNSADIAAISNKIKKMFQSEQKRGFLFSSANSGEGVGSLVDSVGVSLSKMGIKVLIFELHSDVGALSLLNSLSRQVYLCSHSHSYPGISNYLNSDFLQLKDIVLKSNYKGLSYIKSGDVKIVKDDLYSSKLEKTIHILKDHYQIILFDCRPILESSDFQAILNFCDLSILVVRAGFQSSIKIKNALSRLVNMKINSVEAVLSCVNEEYF